MGLFIDRYWQNAGDECPEGYYGEDGIHYGDTALEFIHSYYFGFCTCGNPEQAMRFVRDTLRQVKAKMTGLVASDAAFLCLYLLDEKRLTDHGSTIQTAWLTETGEEVLSDLETLFAENADE